MTGDPFAAFDAAMRASAGYEDDMRAICEAAQRLQPGELERLRELAVSTWRQFPPDVDAEIKRGVDIAKSKPKPNGQKADWRAMTIKARDLADRRYRQPKFILPGLVPEGVTLLAARPKIGKTWLLQQIATAVSGNPGTLGVTARCGDVLELNLEDGERRAQSRMTKYFGANPNNWPERLEIASAWRPLDEGGIGDLREWCRSVSEPTLITIDILKRVRSARKRTQSDYEADYEACKPLIDLSHEFPGLGIIVTAHDRKAAADDVFDTVSGTLGLTGGVDAVAMIKRNQQGLSLHVQGRDLEDTIEKAIEFDRESCRWQIMGDVSQMPKTDMRSLIVAALSASSQPMSVDALMMATRARNRGTLNNTLSRMVSDGTISRAEPGKYAAGNR